MCPTVDVIDAGELATAPTILGICHPTGYPLFTIVGWMFSHLLVPFRAIVRMNLMAAFMCAAGLFFFFKFLVFFIEEFTLADVAAPLKSPPSNRQSVDGASVPRLFAVVIPAACGTLLLAFSETYWDQALSIEVYSTHVFLLSLLLLVFSQAVSQSGFAAREKGLGVKLWYVFAYGLGLAFCNHMTTILLAPAFLFAYFYAHRFGAQSWKRLARMTPFFLGGLSLYAYLVIRAGNHPLLNWGNPISLERLYWHFSGKQYRVWLFASTEGAMKQLSYFIDTIAPEFAYFPLALAAVGIFALFARRKTALVFTLLLFFGCVLYSINYDIHDIDSYFLLAYFAVIIWAATGIADLIVRASRSNMLKEAAIGFVALSFVPMFIIFPRVNERDFTIVEQYTNDILKSAEPNAVIISYQWDYFVSAMYYFQILEAKRPDVTVIDKELMRRSWYYVQMQARYPWLYEQNKPEIAAFLKDDSLFERDLPYDPGSIEYHYAALIHSIIQKNLETRPVYVTPEIEREYLRGFQLVPEGILFRLYADSLVHSASIPAFDFALPSKGGKYVDGIVGMYARAYANHAIYLNARGQFDSALVSVNKALELDPSMREGNALKEQLEARLGSRK